LRLSPVNLSLCKHEVTWENVVRHIAPFVLQHRVRWKVIRQLHAQFILPSEKQPAVHTAIDAGWDPVPIYTLWSREKYVVPACIQTTIPRSSASFYIHYIEYEVAAHTT
jgi:hypothetical protein